MPEKRFLDLAIDIVLNSGAIQLRRLVSGFTVSAKGALDIVTTVDLEIEAMCRETIAAHCPGHVVVGEEMDNPAPAAGLTHRWLFDPIDGTANFAHGVPFFCTSLALEVDGCVELAAVYEPMRGELFTAERGRGARRNQEIASVSEVAAIREAMVGTGYPHGAVSRDEAMEDLLAEVAIRARGIRRLGSAALDLCYVACGRFDGFWDQNLQAWDTAAGALIVVEAGGVVTGLTGAPFNCYAGDVLASNGRLHAYLVDLMPSAD
jgi:myo-inositol-1(or 4)-monophosphatase